MEAEYASACRKLTVPIMVQRGYRPDGWLGRRLGSFFLNISEHADGERRGPATIRGLPKRRVPPRPSPCCPLIRSSPSAFAVGMLRKVDKNRSRLWHDVSSSERLELNLPKLVGALWAVVGSQG